MEQKEANQQPHVLIEFLRGFCNKKKSTLRIPHSIIVSRWISFTHIHYNRNVYATAKTNYTPIRTPSFGSCAQQSHWQHGSCPLLSTVLLLCLLNIIHNAALPANYSKRHFLINKLLHSWCQKIKDILQKCKGVRSGSNIFPSMSLWHQHFSEMCLFYLMESKMTN